MSLPLSGTVALAPSAVVFVRHRRARRYILRVLSDGTLRVTLPRWGVKRDAQAFVEASRDWIARQRLRRVARVPAVRPWTPGTRVLVDGIEAALRTQPHSGGTAVWCDTTLVAVVRTLPADLRPVVEGWLRERARRQLPDELMSLAAAHDISVARVSIRNQRSRWGSCSPSGTITLNWRLVHVPPFVREYVLLHELMHRRQMNHSRRFWRLVAACCPRHADARRWLRVEGALLWSDRV
jgi:predicted metal-dependent hydrolase